MANFPILASLFLCYFVSNLIRIDHPEIEHPVELQLHIVECDGALLRDLDRDFPQTLHEADAVDHGQEEVQALKLFFRISFSGCFLAGPRVSPPRLKKGGISFRPWHCFSRTHRLQNFVEAAHALDNPGLLLGDEVDDGIPGVRLSHGNHIQNWHSLEKSAKSRNYCFICTFQIRI